MDNGSQGNMAKTPVTYKEGNTTGPPKLTAPTAGTPKSNPAPREHVEARDGNNNYETNTVGTANGDGRTAPRPGTSTGAIPKSLPGPTLAEVVQRQDRMDGRLGTAFYMHFALPST